MQFVQSSNLSLVYEKPDEFYFPSEYFRVVECLECGCGFVNPRPTAQEITRYYPQGSIQIFGKLL